MILIGFKILILLWVFTLLFSVSKMSSKPKQCETCGRDFTKMSQQAFHEHLMKHEDKEHPCTVCPKTFPSARMLRYHKLKVHCKKVVCQCWRDPCMVTIFLHVWLISTLVICEMWNERLKLHAQTIHEVNINCFGGCIHHAVTTNNLQV